jgi:hypothetical protein
MVGDGGRLKLGFLGAVDGEMAVVSAVEAGFGPNSL